MSSNANRSGMLNFILEKWSSAGSLCSSPLYKSGASNNEIETVLIQNGTVVVPSFASTYEEADMLIMHHVVYCVRFLNTERIIIYANDADIIISCIHFCGKNSKREL